MLLSEIKTAIGDKELVPGRREDMIAFTVELVPKINDVIDFVHVSMNEETIGRLLAEPEC